MPVPRVPHLRGSVLAARVHMCKPSVLYATLDTCSLWPFRSKQGIAGPRCLLHLRVCFSVAAARKTMGEPSGLYATLFYILVGPP